MGGKIVEESLIRDERVHKRDENQCLVSIDLELSMKRGSDRRYRILGLIEPFLKI